MKKIKTIISMALTTNSVSAQVNSVVGAINKSMRRLIVMLISATCSLSVYAQVKVSESIFDFYNNFKHIPAYLTKEIKPVIYSYNDFVKSDITVYDEDLKIIKSYSTSSDRFTFQERLINYKRLMDPDTKELLSDWEVESDVYYENGGINNINPLWLVTENGEQKVYLTQTLLDEDEDFEFIRIKNEVIPIGTKYDDYYKAKGHNIEHYPTEEWLREYGAYSYETMWDDVRQKIIWVLKKEERYGGLGSYTFEIVNLDGIVEKTLNLDFNHQAVLSNGNIYINGIDGTYRLNDHKLPESTAYGPNYDLNRDGKVNVADHVKLSEIIIDQNK